MNGNRERRTYASFSLIEMLVVIIIIGILLGVMTPAFMRSRENAKRKRESTERASLKGAAEAYRFEYGRWPCPHNEESDEERVYSNNNWEVIEYLTSESGAKNVRGIRFLNVSEYSLDAGNVLNPWGEYYVFRFSFTNDTVAVTSAVPATTL